MRAGLTSLLIVAACSPGLKNNVRRFPDRDVAWTEHDDDAIAKTPKASPSLKIAPFVKYDVSEYVDQKMHLEPKWPAEDVNALDEVPCSTWFCARNHLHPLTPEEVAAGPPASPPVLPLTIVSAKEGGITPGVVATDATGAKFLVKFDPRDYVHMATGAEIVGTRLLWAAGYNTPNAFIVDLGPNDLVLSPQAKILKHQFKNERMTAGDLDKLLAGAGREADGRLRAVAVTWVPGDNLGPFPLLGRRKDDPNDRIRHEMRRSLRATYVLMGWMNLADEGPPNTLDSVVTADGRRYVRHYFIDFNDSLGSWAVGPKHSDTGHENVVSYSKTAKSLVTLGAYQRKWQQEKAAALAGANAPEVGYLEVDDFDPTRFRTEERFMPSTMMTDRDAYWGAKLVTSFTDDQIAAAVHEGQYSPGAEEWLTHALEVRRDKIGQAFLTRETALEEPRFENAQVCFTDLAKSRGYVRSATYAWQILDGNGHVLKKGTTDGTCVPAAGTDYRIVKIVASYDGKRAKAAYVHLSNRVLGIDRDE